MVAHELISAQAGRLRNRRPARGVGGAPGGARDKRSEEQAPARSGSKETSAAGRCPGRRAHAARVYDYLLGGRANFSVDRAAAERAYAAWPGGLDGVRADARAHRAVLGRIVRYLARDAGIRQFLDIGTGIPKEGNVHEVAQREAPESRVVYVDRDPIVLARAPVVRGGAHGQLSRLLATDTGIGLRCFMGGYIIRTLCSSVLYINLRRIGMDRRTP